MIINKKKKGRVTDTIIMASLKKAKTKQCLFNCHETVSEMYASLSIKINSPEVDGREIGSMGSLALQ